MTKAELIDAVAEKANVTKADAERTVAAFFEVVVTTTTKVKRLRGRASARSAPQAARHVLVVTRKRVRQLLFLHRPQ